MKVFASVLALTFVAVAVSAAPVGEAANSVDIDNGAAVPSATTDYFPSGIAIPSPSIDASELSELEDMGCDDDFGSDSDDFDDGFDSVDGDDGSQSADGPRKRSHGNRHKGKSGCHPSKSLSGEDGLEAPSIPSSSSDV
ncbi:hypothetical protein EV175_005524 [Coemansia sp. RSA 1933]|nr:hypothetical protein EV175_005524 [Coemansia sp. RSA 1933]